VMRRIVNAFILIIILAFVVGLPVSLALGVADNGSQSATVTVSATPVIAPSPQPQPGGGGGGGGAPPESILTVDTLGETVAMQIKPDGTLLKSYVIADPSGNVIILGLDSGTKIICSDNQVPERLEVSLSEESPPVPEGFVAVSPVYDLTAYISGGVPRPVTFDPPAILQINYSPEELPENVSSVFIAYHDEEEGWTQLEPPTGFVAAVGTAGAQVSHFTPFVVMANLVSPILPARFEVRNLDINPIQVTAGENITVSAQLVNTGGLRGEYTLMVNIEGLLETSQVIRLAPGQSQVITFTLTPGSPGSYQVEIGDSQGNFVVMAIPTPPIPAPPAPAPAPAVGVGVYGWLIPSIVAVAALAALALISARRRLQPALAVEVGVYRWLLPSMSAGAAVADLAFTTARERLQPALALERGVYVYRWLVYRWLLPSIPAVIAMAASAFTTAGKCVQYALAVGVIVYRWLVYRWLLPGILAVAAIAALVFTTARERLQPAAVVKKPPKPVPGAFRVSNVAAIAASAFTTARERLQRAAAVERPPKPVPGAFRISNVAAIAASAFTTARERLQRAAVVKKPPKPVPGAFRVSSVAAIAASAFTTARERLQRVAVVKKPSKPVPGDFRVSNLKITPIRVKPDGSVTIIAEAANIGPVTSSYSLVLKIKGMVEAVKEITLGPGQSQKVAFAILKDKPGVYDVDLEGLKGSFTVEEVAAPPDSSLTKNG